MTRRYTSISLFFFFISSSLFAADIYWTGAGSDKQWTTAANWSGSAVPTSADIAHFAGSTDSVFFNTDVTINGLKIEKNGAINSNIVLKGLGNYKITVATTTAASALFVDAGCQLSVTANALGQVLTLELGSSTAATAGEISGTLSIFGQQRTQRTDGGGKLSVASGTVNVSDLLNLLGGSNPELVGSGSLSINGSATLNLSLDNYALPNISFGPSSNLNITAKILGTLASTYFGNVTLDAASLTANQNIGMPTAALNIGNLSISNANNQSIKLGETPTSVLVRGTTTVSNGTFAFANHTTSTHSNAFIYATLQDDLTIGNGAKLDLQINTGEVSLILQKNLTIQSGGTMDATLAQEFWPASQYNSKVTWGGTGNNSWTVNGSMGTKHYRFVVDKSAGSVILGSNIYLTSYFTFNNGNVEVGNNSLNTTFFITPTSFDNTRHLIMGASGSVTLRDVGSFPVTFPVGISAASYDELKLDRPSPSPATLSFTLKLKDNFSPRTVPVSGNVPREWDITPAGTTSAVNLYFKPDPSVDIATALSRIVARWNGSAWQELTANYTSGVYSVLTPNFSPFGVGRVGGFTVTLPVEFLNIKASEKNTGNLLAWTLETMTDVKHFEVERRNADGKFTPLSNVGKIAPIALQKSYEVLDNQPLKTSYYRIKATELSGKINYSRIVSVNRGGRFTVKSIFPNPTTDRVVFNLENAKSSRLNLEVVDIFGKNLASQTVELTEGQTEFGLDMSDLIEGFYFLKITEGGKTQVFKVMKN
jgi:Secretion system C-terminal sorting domain